jgi:hypothetical protein
MNRFFLFILMLPQALWRKMGADTEQLKALLKVRLLLDGRRPLGMSFKKTTTHKKTNTAVTSSILSFFFGFIYLMPILAMQEQPIMAMAFNYSFINAMAVAKVVSVNYEVFHHSIITDK